MSISARDVLARASRFSAAAATVSHHTRLRFPNETAQPSSHPPAHKWLVHSQSPIVVAMAARGHAIAPPSLDGYVVLSNRQAAATAVIQQSVTEKSGAPVPTFTLRPSSPLLEELQRRRGRDCSPTISADELTALVSSLFAHELFPTPPVKSTAVLLRDVTRRSKHHRCVDRAVRHVARGPAKAVREARIRARLRVALAAIRRATRP